MAAFVSAHVTPALLSCSAQDLSHLGLYEQVIPLLSVEIIHGGLPTQVDSIPCPELWSPSVK